MTSMPPAVSPTEFLHSLFMFFIQRLAWPCGSIISGHRLALATMIPFSTDTASEGRPAICHCLICTGSAKVVWISAPGVCGTFNSTIFPNHSSRSSWRNSGVNGPLYATTPEETTTSPTTCRSFVPRLATVASHRLFSPPKPPISLPARSSCAWHRATSALSSSCFCLPCLNLSFKSVSLASTPANVALASASSVIVTASDDWASASANRFGSIARLTL
mmetsp:Transcript_6043/g.20083  ORF Transcript_6043/g.20083 Transcript_6043/m.20083 type:complete len:219 (-) Transcript_6043:345-1001(-)